MKTKLTLALAALLVVTVWLTPICVVAQTPSTSQQAEVKIDPEIFYAYVGQYQDAEGHIQLQLAISFLITHLRQRECMSR
jgi:hypothetical protein